MNAIVQGIRTMIRKHRAQLDSSPSCGCWESSASRSRIVDRSGCRSVPPTAGPPAVPSGTSLGALVWKSWSLIDQYTASRIRAAGVDTLHGPRLAGSNRSLAAYRRSPHPIDRGNRLDLKGSRSSTSKLPADVTGRNRLCTARLKLFGSSRTAVFNPARTMKYRLYCVF